MDFKMKAEEISLDGTVWDVKVTNGIVPIILDEDERLQCATLAGFLIKGTVPQLPEVGVPWTDFLTKKISFGELDFYVRDSLSKVDKQTYYPSYEIVDEKLTMQVGKLNQEDYYNEL